MTTAFKIDSCYYQLYHNASLWTDFWQYSKGARKGGLGLNPPWAWYFTKTLLSAQRGLIVSHTFCLLIFPFATSAKKMIRFWWESGLYSASRNNLTTFRRPFVHYACLKDCVPRQFTLFKTIIFILSAMADQRKRWPHWLH